MFFRPGITFLFFCLCLTISAANRERPGPSSRRTPFVITEIMIDPPLLPKPGTEFVEIYNSQPFPEELGGSRLSGDIDYVFPEKTSLAGKSTLIVAKDPQLFRDRYSL